MGKKIAEWSIFGIIALSLVTVAFHMGQLLLGIIAVAIVFWLFMLLDCLQRNTEDYPRAGKNEKLIWLLVLIFLNFIGAVLYNFLVKMQDNRTIIS